MSVRLGTVVVDANDPVGLAAFWTSVLTGWRVVDVDEDDGAVEIGPGDDPGDGSSVTLLFAPVPEPKAVKNRLHLDLHPVGVEQAEELQRLLALGARQVDVGQGDQTWVVLADPEGNEFCLLRTPG